MSETALQASYLLHYTPWRDTSFIVDLFTLEHGRIGLMARGARGAKPRTRALYQPFRPLLVSWTGEGELHTLTGIEESGPAVPLEGAALGSGYYLNELVLRLLGKEQPQPELFAHYALALATLAHVAVATGPAAAIETTLRTFELQLLETIGVLPDLARCAPGGAAIEPDRRYRFHPTGALAVPLTVGGGGDASGGADDEALGIPKRSAAGTRADAVAEHGLHPDGVTHDDGVEVTGRTLLDMAALDFASARTREQAKTLMRRLVAGQLDGRPLRSRSMFEALVPPPVRVGEGGNGDEGEEGGTAGEGEDEVSAVAEASRASIDTDDRDPL